MTGAQAPSGAVALVGGRGLVGTALSARLAGRQPVVVVDRVDAGLVPAAGSFARVDLTDDDAGATLAALFTRHAVSTVVHLAARVDPPRNEHDRRRMLRLHEHGTRATVAAARAAAVRHFVLVSSAVVYGAWPDNPVPILEDASVRPSPFPYALDKALQERVARETWQAGGGRDDGLAIVRPAIVYAPQARSYLTEILRRARLPLRLPRIGGIPAVPRGVLPALDGHRPPLQFVHVDDVAAVLHAVIDSSAAGVFHACAADWLAFEDVARAAELAVIDVDARQIGRLLDRLVPLLPPSLRAPSTLFPYLMHPFVLSSTQTTARLGVRPVWSSRAALQAMLTGRGRPRPG
jgi:UDP-glucose 4-epimerase